jgi:hypothetical protein
LAALILHGQGFFDVDPSHPLGGRDGLKDIVLSYEGNRWISGVYFARGQQTFSNIKAKFKHDIEGAKSNDVVGFVFITNQELRLAERRELEDISPEIDVKIYHLEQIACLLNSVQHYGHRLDFLEIEMSKEEQISFFSTEMTSVNAALNKLTVSHNEFKDMILTHLCENGELDFDAPRSIDEIAEMANEFCEKIWYDRHLCRCERMAKGTEDIKPEIWAGALVSAERVVAKYGEENLSPYSKFDWGMLNGKLSALRWVLGDDWDMLDT